MKTLFIKHDGSVESVDGIAAGNLVVRDDVEYISLDLLRHPKIGKISCRIMVAQACHPFVNPYIFFDGKTFDTRSGEVK